MKTKKLFCAVISAVAVRRRDNGIPQRGEKTRPSHGRYFNRAYVCRPSLPLKSGLKRKKAHKGRRARIGIPIQSIYKNGV